MHAIDGTSPCPLLGLSAPFVGYSPVQPAGVIRAPGASESCEWMNSMASSTT